MAFRGFQAQISGTFSAYGAAYAAARETLGPETGRNTGFRS